MTQEQALERAKLLRPDIADFIAVERVRRIGCEYGHANRFIIFDHTNDGCVWIAESVVNWEAAIAQMEHGRDDSPIPEPDATEV